MKLVQFHLPARGVVMGSWVEKEVYELVARKDDAPRNVSAVIARACSEGAGIEETVQAYFGVGGRHRYDDLNTAPRRDQAHLLMPVFCPEAWC